MYNWWRNCPDRNDQVYTFLYHLKENKWTRLPAHLPQQGGVVVVNINNKLTVLGGYNHTTTRPTNKVITLQDDHWTSLYSDMNSARNRPTVTSHHQYTIVAGGVDHDEVLLDSIEVFNINTNQRTTSKTCLPEPMYFISATTSNNSLVITGYNNKDGTRVTGAHITTMDNIIDHSGSTTSSSTATYL